MQVNTEIKDGVSLLRIEGEMTIYTAADLKAQLLPRLASPYELEIDLSGVSELDSAGVQLLMLAKREAGLGGRELRLSRHSPAVLEVFELCQLGGYFGDPLVFAGRGQGDA
ncbi:STAS domain-containing protein [Zobellella aerophila]|uniref:STAS domain-containing protein n=1 Tax=Zobellella aerophila TaxID=870480 RepID=A0ABP6VUQ5_9GAMM